MAVIALTSASGSPGVTTTAVGLAMLWPRPVLLVEADPTGGSGVLAGFFRGVRDYEAGLFELAFAPVVADALPGVAQRIEGSHVSFVAGTRSHLQSGGLRELWEPFADALAGLEATGQDVIIDAGRLGLVGSPEALLAAADLTLLVTRTTLPALAAARSWADSIGQHGVFPWRRPGLLITGEGQPYPAKTIADVLKLPIVAKITDDASAAAVYHQGVKPPRRFATSPYARSLRAAVESLQTQAARSRSELTEVVSP